MLSPSPIRPLQRALPALLAGLLGACVADPLPTPEPADAHLVDGGGDGGDTPPDGAPGTDLAPPADRGPMVIDAARDMDPTPRDMAPDLAPPDLGPLGPEVDPPDYTEVAVIRGGEASFFLWIDAAGDLLRLRVGADGRAGAPERLESPAVRPETVVALDVGGHPWVAYGDATSPVVLFQVDLPRLTRTVLDVHGPPLLAAAGDGVLVIGKDPEGALSWQRVDNDLTVEAPYVDRLGLELPDAAAGVPAGVVLGYDGPGQCIQIDDRDWRPSGNFLCPGGQMQLLSDGRQTLISRLYTFGNDQSVGVRPLYARADDYRLGFFEVSAGTRFRAEGPRRPMVVARIYDGARRLVASVVDPEETWDTVETWTDTTDWPFARVRAMARRSLPALAREGTCDDGSACVLADDCGGDPCAGGVPAEHLLALDFLIDGRPRVRRYPMLRRRVGTPAYGIDRPDGCVPQVEVCDLLDQDCDRLVDDGLCCLSTANISYRWTTLRAVAHTEENGRLSYDMLLADVQSNNAYRLLYRYADSDEWAGKTLNLRQDPSGVPGNLGIRFEGAREGRFLISAGGITGLVARQVEADGSDGDWALFLAHPNRVGPDDAPPRPVVPLDCDEVLAADALVHASPANQLGDGSGEQIVIVCPDKMLRIYTVGGRPDGVYPFAGFSLTPVEWATIARTGEAELEVMVGYPVPGEGLWAVRVFEFDGEGHDPPRLGLVPGQLAGMGPTDAAAPIHRHPVTGRPPIQIRPGPRARMAFEEQDARGNDITVWRDALLGPEPDRIVFSPRRFRLFASAAVEPEAGFAEATGWWAANVQGDDRLYGLWSTESVFELQGPIAAWYATQGTYFLDDQFFDISRYDLGIVFPTHPDEADHTRFRFITRETRCVRP